MKYTSSQSKHDKTFINVSPLLRRAIKKQTLTLLKLSTGSTSRQTIFQNAQSEIKLSLQQGGMLIFSQSIMPTKPCAEKISRFVTARERERESEIIRKFWSYHSCHFCKQLPTALQPLGVSDSVGSLRAKLNNQMHCQICTWRGYFGLHEIQRREAGFPADIVSQ